MGLPVSTAQKRTSNRNLCTWSSANSFYTTTDLSPALTAYTAGKELECEVIAGAGGGVLEQVDTITYESGTYVVTLKNNVPGAASGRYCDVLIDNWEKLEGITSTTTENYKKLPGAKASHWYKLKVELRGVNTTFEALQFINAVHKVI